MRHDKRPQSRLELTREAFMARRRPLLDAYSLLTTLYRFEADPHRWLDNVVTTAADRMNLGAGVGGVLYDVANEQAARGSYVTARGAAEGWVRAGAVMHDDPEMMPRVVAAYRTITCANALQVAEHAQMPQTVRTAYLRAMNSFGIGDEMLINGRASGHTGAALYLFDHRPVSWSPRQRASLHDLANHIGNALRLQQQMAEAGITREARAIVDRRGNVQHLSEELAWNKRSRRALAEAARTNVIERLANKQWGQGFSFVDYFDRDGKEFVILCRTEPKPRQLSPRERQVVECAVLGSTEKEIAYTLGIAGSTVRVLLGRAARKLGVKTRSELIAKLERERR